jgi:hypothetical protein
MRGAQRHAAAWLSNAKGTGAKVGGRMDLDQLKTTILDEFGVKTDLPAESVCTKVARCDLILHRAIESNCIGAVIFQRSSAVV